MVDWRQYLTSDPDICDGQLCAKGTIVPVTIILDSLAEGDRRAEMILRSYPSLKPEHLDAAVAYAAELAREENLLPLRPEWETSPSGEIRRMRKAAIESEGESVILNPVEAPEGEFGLFAAQWRRETGMLSSISKKAMHPTYQRIIGMGDKAVTPILLQLQEQPDHWFWALNAITGENPVPQESAGNLQEMAKAWIQWGREMGYIS